MLRPAAPLTLTPQYTSEAETGVLITGAITLASSYVTTVVTALLLAELFYSDYESQPCRPCQGRNWLTVPVAGPWLEESKVGYYPGFFTMFFGVSQVAGLATTLIGLAHALASERQRPAAGLSSEELSFVALPTPTGAHMQLKLAF